MNFIHTGTSVNCWKIQTRSILYEMECVWEVLRTLATCSNQLSSGWKPNSLHFIWKISTFMNFKICLKKTLAQTQIHTYYVNLLLCHSQLRLICLIVLEVVFHFLFYLRSSSIFFWGPLSSWVKIRLHTENQLPRLPGSALKVPVWWGWVGWVPTHY